MACSVHRRDADRRVSRERRGPAPDRPALNDQRHDQEARSRANVADAEARAVLTHAHALAEAVASAWYANVLGRLDLTDDEIEYAFLRLVERLVLQITHAERLAA